MANFYRGAPIGDIFTRTQAGAFLPTIWSQDIIRNRDLSFMMRGCVSAFNFGGRKGDTIRIPFLSDLKSHRFVIGIPLEYQATEENWWTMRVDRRTYAAFAIDDLLNIQADRDLRSIYTERAGYALAKDLEYSLLAERATINAWKSGANVITSSGILDYTDILAAHERLNVLGVPEQGRKLIISPQQEASLLTQPEFIHADYNTGNAISTGSFGKSILGTPFQVTRVLAKNTVDGYINGDDEDTNAERMPTAGMTDSPYFPTQKPELKDGSTLTASGLPAGYHTAMLVHPQWCKLAIQRAPKVEHERSIEYQQERVAVTQIYDVKVFRPDACVLINTVED